MVYVHLQNWYSSLFLSCKDICLNLVLSRIILAITPCKTSFPAWGLNQILLVRKSFVSKDKENTRYWFFFCMKNLTPRRLNFWRLLRSNSCLLGTNCVEMLHPSVRCDQVPVGCRGKELLKLRSDGRFLNHFVLLELLLLHRRVCRYGLLLYLYYSCWVGEGLIIEAAVISLPCANRETYKTDAYLLLHMRNYTHWKRV